MSNWTDAEAWDHFAAAALTGLLSRPPASGPGAGILPPNHVRRAAECADEMVALRQERRDNRPSPLDGLNIKM